MCLKKQKNPPAQPGASLHNQPSETAETHNQYIVSIKHFLTIKKTKKDKMFHL